MLKLIDIITNNYFLKQKLKVTIPKTPVRRLTDNWQGSTKSGKRILSNPTNTCLLYTSPSPRDMRRSRMPSSA